MTDVRRVACPRCRSRCTVKNGRHPATGTQKMFCRACGRSYRTAYRYPACKESITVERRVESPRWESQRSPSKDLRTVPLRLSEANAFVVKHHRHHPPVLGYLFAIGASDGQALVGVVIVGRPVSRNLDDGQTAEVTRCCTDGTRHVPSLLYGAARRAAFALGYRRIITYTLASESGVSLQASGWTCAGEAGGGSGNVPSRPRTDRHPTERKRRWESQA